jgi:putative addiction module killer protein
MFQIRYFELDSGVGPFETWISSLDIRSRAKVRAYIDRVALGGSKKNIRCLGEGLNEIKIDFGPGFRIYYGIIGNEIMLLLGGGDKGSQPRDIEKAYEFWRQVNAST